MLRLCRLGRLGDSADTGRWFTGLLHLLHRLRYSRIAVSLDAYAVGRGWQDEAAAVLL